MISIYIGIPFCSSRCLYCSFTSNSIDKYMKNNMVDTYMKCLKKEILAVSKIIEKNSYAIQSVYIGGGTPTSIPPEYLHELLDHIQHYLIHNDTSCEFTLEAGRPDSLSIEKFKIIKNSNVNRISINPQTMNNDTLKLIGRNHTREDIIKCYYEAREVGFNNVNMDIIVGLPQEDISMFNYTLDEISKLSPESLTVHTMAIKRASNLNLEKHNYTLIDENNASNMVRMAMEYATNMNMKPYYLYRQKNILGNLENIGYSRPGFESIYNVQIMEEKQNVLALGAGAISKLIFPRENRLERVFNVKGIEEYIARIDEMIEKKMSAFC